MKTFYRRMSTHMDGQANMAYLRPVSWRIKSMSLCWFNWKVIKLLYYPGEKLHETFVHNKVSIAYKYYYAIMTAIKYRNVLSKQHQGLEFVTYIVVYSWLPDCQRLSDNYWYLESIPRLEERQYKGDTVFFFFTKSNYQHNRPPTVTTWYSRMLDDIRELFRKKA